jgi:CRISPR-associated protein Csb2
MQPPPEWVSGHPPSGGRSGKDHIAIFPLANVGYEYSDGRVLGLAIAVPREIGDKDQAACWTGMLYDTMGMVNGLEMKMGSLGAWRVELEQRPDDERPLSLRNTTWVGERPARRWSTVTPIVLDHHPKNKDRFKEMENDIGDACLKIGLPRPEAVSVSNVSMFTGTPVSRDFPLLRRKSDSGGMMHTHAVITFPEPVCGPILIGAGRYRGYGLCRPLPEMGMDE